MSRTVATFDAFRASAMVDVTLGRLRTLYALARVGHAVQVLAVASIAADVILWAATGSGAPRAAEIGAWATFLAVMIAGHFAEKHAVRVTNEMDQLALRTFAALFTAEKEPPSPDPIVERAYRIAFEAFDKISDQAFVRQRERGNIEAPPDEPAAPDAVTPAA